MRRIAQLVSWLALLWTILPSILFYFDRMKLDTLKVHMLIATIVWFVATPIWMGRAPASQPEQQ